MQLLLISTLVVALAIPTAAAKAGEYRQCGGKDWKGPKECTDGFKCTFDSEYHSLCLPKPVDTSRFVPRYGQCGGKNWKGLTKCADGSFCNKNDLVYYWECRPDSEKPRSLRTL